jgi:hypothetical protein
MVVLGRTEVLLWSCEKKNHGCVESLAECGHLGRRGAVSATDHPDWEKSVVYDSGQKRAPSDGERFG